MNEEELKKIRKELGIDEYLELIKEDRLLNDSYTSLAQYMDILEKNLQQKDKAIDDAINFIENHSRKEPPHYEFLEFYNKANLSELYDILKKYKGDNNG